MTDTQNYKRPTKRITLDDECARIAREFDSSFASTMTMLERQFTVLHNRAQLLLTLCGIVISTTGFSGRVIAGTNSVAQWLIIVGIGLVLLSAVVVVSGVLHLRWLTLQPGENYVAWLHESLSYRDKKTGWYRAGIVLMLIGLTFYVAAISVMLLYPHVDGLPAR